MKQFFIGKILPICLTAACMNSSIVLGAADSLREETGLKGLLLRFFNVPTLVELAIKDMVILVVGSGVAIWASVKLIKWVCSLFKSK